MKKLVIALAAVVGLAMAIGADDAYARSGGGGHSGAAAAVPVAGWPCRRWRPLFWRPLFGLQRAWRLLSRRALRWPLWRPLWRPLRWRLLRLRRRGLPRQPLVLGLAAGHGTATPIRTTRTGRIPSTNRHPRSTSSRRRRRIRPCRRRSAPPNLWYYCTNPAGYYPYVQNCSVAWVKVVPPPAPATPSGSIAPGPANPHGRPRLGRARKVRTR